MIKPAVVRCIKECGDCCGRNLPMLEAAERMREQFPQLAPQIDELREMHDHLTTIHQLGSAAIGAT